MDQLKERPYKVHYRAMQLGDECIPCIAIEIYKEGNEEPEWIYRHLGSKGIFNNLEAAEKAAREIKVTHQYINGELLFSLS